MHELNLLSRLQLFQGVSDEGLAELGARAQLRRFHKGSKLTRQGKPSCSIHVVVSGRVRVERGHPELSEPVVLALLGPGEVVGDLGVLDGARSLNTAITLQETATVEVGVADLLALVQRFPEIAEALLFSRMSTQTRPLIAATDEIPLGLD